MLCSYCLSERVCSGPCWWAASLWQAAHSPWRRVCQRGSAPGRVGGLPASLWQAAGPLTMETSLSKRVCSRPCWWAASLWQAAGPLTMETSLSKRVCSRPCWWAAPNCDRRPAHSPWRQVCQRGSAPGRVGGLPHCDRRPAHSPWRQVCQRGSAPGRVGGLPHFPALSGPVAASRPRNTQSERLSSHNIVSLLVHHTVSNFQSIQLSTDDWMVNFHRYSRISGLLNFVYCDSIIFFPQHNQ